MELSFVLWLAFRHTINDCGISHAKINIVLISYSTFSFLFL